MLPCLSAVTASHPESQPPTPSVLSRGPPETLNPLHPFHAVAGFPSVAEPQSTTCNTCVCVCVCVCVRDCAWEGKNRGPVAWPQASAPYVEAILFSPHHIRRRRTARPICKKNLVIPSPGALTSARRWPVGNESTNIVNITFHLAPSLTSCPLLCSLRVLMAEQRKTLHTGKDGCSVISSRTCSQIPRDAVAVPLRR